MRQAVRIKTKKSRVAKREAGKIPGAERKITADTNITEAEVFCIEAVKKALKDKGIGRQDEMYVDMCKRTAAIIIHNRQGIWDRYMQSKEGLRDWILWKMGLRKVEAYDKMRRMGLTGDVIHDMEVLGHR